jgi:hypothetical protein
LHDWNVTREDTLSGQFLYYNENNQTPKAVPPLPLAGSAVDGSKTIHAAGVYNPEVNPPVMSKDKNNALFYIGEELWELREDDKILKQYPTKDLRMTIVYRARCFESKKSFE